MKSQRPWQNVSKVDASSNHPAHQLSARAANERIAALNRRWGTDSFPSSFICECLDPNCSERILVPHEEYDRLRQSGTFVMLPGH